VCLLYQCILIFLEEALKPQTKDVVRAKAKLFRGLGDVSRLSIVEVLRDGPKNVSQVVKATGLTQPNTSMHLNCLWCCGLVDREVRGRFTWYWIKSERFTRIIKAAEEVLEEVFDRIEECRRYEDPVEG
jgi:DNA-binding transcriptional ArsR family regulator